MSGSNEPRSVLLEALLPSHAVIKDVFKNIRLGVAVLCGRQADGAAFAQMAADVHFQNAAFALFKVDPVVNAKVVQGPRGRPNFPDVCNDILLQIVHGYKLVAQMVMQFEVFRDDVAGFVGLRLYESQDDGFFSPPALEQ